MIFASHLELLLVRAIFALMPLLLAVVACSVSGRNTAFTSEPALVAAGLVRGHLGYTSVSSTALIGGLARAVAGNVANLATCATVTGINLLRCCAITGDVPNFTTIAACPRVRNSASSLPLLRRGENILTTQVIFSRKKIQRNF